MIEHAYQSKARLICPEPPMSLSFVTRTPRVKPLHLRVRALVILRLRGMKCHNVNSHPDWVCERG